MKVIGLSGSIGMGKTTVCKQINRLGVPVHNADACVHALLARGGRGVGPVAARFPTSFQRGQIHRPTLASLVFNNKAALADLEAILHPLVRQETDAWIKTQRRLGHNVVVLEVPLLFEGKSDHQLAALYDEIWVVSAPAFLQQQRVMRRGGISPESFKARLARQLPDAKKRQKADLVILTGLGLFASMAYLKKQRHRLHGRGTAYSPTWKSL